MTYLVRFSRYNRNTCESRLSGVTWLHADDFDGAHRIASAMLTGMQSADPDCDYRIMIIDGSRDMRGLDCMNGARMWETGEEMSARLAQQA